MKKLLLMFSAIIMITTISGCSLFTKEVDYKKIANDLNQKNMDEILYSENGYAKYDQVSFIVTTYRLNGKVKEEKNKITINPNYESAAI